MASLAQSDSTPSPSASYFDRLPLELVKVVVGMVHAQDQAFKDSGIGRAEPEDEKRREEVNILKGRYSPRYGRGIAALACTSKLLRELCFPLVVETVTIKQLAAPYFRFKLAQRPAVCASIKHLEFDSATLAEVVDGASVLHLLHEAKRLSFAGACRELLSVLLQPTGGQMGGEHGVYTLAADALLDLASRAVDVSFETHDIFVGLVEVVLGSVDPAALRRLALKPENTRVFSFDSADAPMLHALQRLDQLETLDIVDRAANGLDYTVHPSWRDGLRLHSLRSLSLLVGNAANELLPVVQHAAPNLRRLELAGILKSDPLNLDFPHLRHLTIAADGWNLDIASNFLSSPLVSLHFNLAAMVEFDCDDFFGYHFLPNYEPAFPPTVRTVSCTILSPIPPRDVVEFTDKFAARGIDFRCRWVPDTYLMTPELVEEPYPHMYTSSTYWREAAGEALDWARDRLRWADETGDDRSADELVMAVMRVRERQVIEMQ
ncbi:hypothetical protein JCM8097_001626 [Rhodosporidiobolus ruineniae]